tara:strand:+ start:41275 stop:41595 length:321 start_codon:yes stop_codon:yes gene_type:complete
MKFKIIGGANSHIFDGQLINETGQCVAFVHRETEFADHILACLEAMAGIDDPVAFFSDLRKDLEHMSGLRKQADDVVGLVDSPHMKALNAAVKISAALLSRMGGGE